MVELILLVMSLINRRNSRGPNSDPWGTPESTLQVELFLFSNTTCCVLATDTAKSIFLSTIMIQFVKMTV